MQGLTSTEPPASAVAAEAKQYTLPLPIAALVGAIGGAAVLGFGVLGARLVTLTSEQRAATAFLGEMPTGFWWLAPTIVVVVGACAGVASRRRPLPGLVVICLLGAVAVWKVLSTGSSALELSVPLGATLAGAITFGTLLQVTRAGRGSTHRVPPERAASRHQERDDADRVAMSRRRALVTGTLIAAGAGLAGFVIRPPASRQPQRPAPWAIDRTPLLNDRPVVNVRDFGAIGDGRTDDGEAIRQGLAAANAAAGTLFFPAGTYYYRATRALHPAAGVTIAGVPGASAIDFDSRAEGEFVEFCSLAASGVTIDGLIIRRAADFSAVLLSMGAFQDFTLSRTMLVGNQDLFPGTYCHGIKLGGNYSGTTTGIHLIECTITTTQFGLLQANESTATTTDIQVLHCTFTGNRNTDLEFNSPNGSIRRLRIEECIFSNNDSPGFGVGLAHVGDALVRGNTFDNYALEAVHIEDYSEDITVRGNEFSACGLRNHSHVQIIGGARGVQIVDNTFRASMNTNKIYVVNALPGGTELTVGGRDPIPPFDVTVRNNTFECGNLVVPVYFQAIQRGSIAANKIFGENVSAPDDAIRLIDDAGTTIRDNEINGQNF